MTINNLVSMLVVVVHIDTGNSKRRPISNSNRILAVRFINAPE